MIFTLAQGEGQALLVGLSSDQKPASAAGQVFIESDTGHVFHPGGSGTWAQATVVAAAAWGAIGGTLASQTDLQNALNEKAAVSSIPADWTYLKVSSQHYGTSSVIFRDLNGLQFIPGTNSTYEVEFHLMCKTSTAAVTPRIGVRWPTGCSTTGWINQGQTNSTQLFTWGNQVSTMNIPASGLLATTTAAWGVIGGAVIQAYGAAASSFALMHATESTSVFVSTMIGSYLKYRPI